MSKVIVKFLDGNSMNGDVLNFNVKNPAFHLQVSTESGMETWQVQLNSVQMVQFLKQDASEKPILRTETIDKSIYAGTLSYKLRLRFKDGETLSGSAANYNPYDKGFFLIPLNPADKSLKIYVNTEALEEINSTKLLGKILRDQNKISDDQLDRSLKVQKEMREKPIGAILVEKAFITKKQLNDSLKKQKESNKLLGQLLMEAGYISQEQLNEAVVVQQSNRRKKLGQILVELSYISPNDICIALATQYNLPWIDLEDVRIDPKVARKLSPEIVRKLEVIPIELNGQTLMVATSQPQIPEIGDELRKNSKLQIGMVIAYEVYIHKAILQFFGPEGDND